MQGRGGQGRFRQRGRGGGLPGAGSGGNGPELGRGPHRAGPNQAQRLGRCAERRRVPSRGAQHALLGSFRA